MKWGFGIEPALDHQTCIVDLFGRCGMLKEALAIIVKMVILPDSRIRSALLAASRVYGNKKFGEYAAQRLSELEPDNAGYYTLLSNIKASVGRWDEVEKLRRVMTERDLKKKSTEKMEVTHNHELTVKINNTRLNVVRLPTATYIQTDNY